ncbi:MAG: 4-alpha-glucanotransferase [Angustibacter sp.]
MSGPGEPGETAAEPGEAVSEPGEEDSGTPGQHTSPDMAREVSPDTAREVSPDTAREVSPDTAREVSPREATSPGMARGDTSPDMAREAREVSPGGDAPSAVLQELAQAYGVATEYWDWRGQQVTVPDRTIWAVLCSLGVAGGGGVGSPGGQVPDDEAARLALLEHDLAPWRRTLPPVVVTRAGWTPRVPVHLRHGAQVTAWVELEDGGRRDLAQLDEWVEPRVIDGEQIGEAVFVVPGDLPLGWHRIQVEIRADSDTRASAAPATDLASGPTAGLPEPGSRTLEPVAASCSLVVTPGQLMVPSALDAGQSWGFMTQLYAIRSARSWGVGDLDDLAELAVWSAADGGADFVLVNPLHAAEPVPPMEPSPYLPTTRRFVNPLYIRVESVPEVATMPSAERQLLEWQADAVIPTNSDDDIDRDAAWIAKRSALETVFALPRSLGRRREFAAFCDEQGAGLTDFATWCALTEEYGPAWVRWPRELQDPRSPQVARERERLQVRVDFYRWLQWIADEQLAAAHRRSREAGMALGVVHDLAVGVHPQGADTWSLGSALARGVTVGAPPDPFNQQGQDWSQPPWRPDQLAESGYAPYRDMLRTVLRHAGGVRVDHVIGLFRLWWVPEGATPEDGTYVRCDHEALVGILALEAHRAGAVVIGEDLGVVEPWVRTYLTERGILGTSISWFERTEAGDPLPPEQWRELCLATVATHDLPPTAGYLAGVHVDLRDQLGLLDRPVEEERAEDDADREEILEELARRGLLREGATEQETVEALHRLLTWTPSRLVGVAVADAVGDRRPINQPGTDEEYPNWRLPITDSAGRVVLLEDLPRSERVASLIRAVRSPR